MKKSSTSFSRQKGASEHIECYYVSDTESFMIPDRSTRIANLWLGLPDDIRKIIFSFKQQLEEFDSRVYRTGVNQRTNHYQKHWVRSINNLYPLKTLRVKFIKESERSQMISRGLNGYRYILVCDRCKMIKGQVNCLCSKTPKACRRQYNKIKDVVVRAKSVNRIKESISNKRRYESRLAGTLIESMGMIETPKFPKNNRNLDIMYRKLIEEKEYLMSHPWVQKIDYLNSQIDKIENMFNNGNLSKRASNKIKSFNKKRRKRLCVELFDSLTTEALMELIKGDN